MSAPSGAGVTGIGTVPACWRPVVRAWGRGGMGVPRMRSCGLGTDEHNSATETGRRGGWCVHGGTDIASAAGLSVHACGRALALQRCGGEREGEWLGASGRNVAAGTRVAEEEVAAGDGLAKA